MRLTVAESLKQLKTSEKEFIELFSHGSLSVEIYKPKEKDLQTPHTRDEIYVVISGSGKFQNDGTVTEFQQGDFLFVAAGKEHRFLDFTNDFATWVFFYGPEGGE